MMFPQDSQKEKLRRELWQLEAESKILRDTTDDGSLGAHIAQIRKTIENLQFSSATSNADPSVWSSNVQKVRASIEELIAGEHCEAPVARLYRDEVFEGQGLAETQGRRCISVVTAINVSFPSIIIPGGATILIPLSHDSDSRWIEIYLNKDFIGEPVYYDLKKQDYPESGVLIRKGSREMV